MSSSKEKLFHNAPEYALVLLTAVLVWLHYQTAPPVLSGVFPASAHEYSIAMQYESPGEDLFISTYLPKSSERQRVLDERIESGSMEQSLYDSVQGLKARWASPAGSGSVNYRALVTTQAYKVHLPESLDIEGTNTDNWAEYLKESDSIQVDHKEIKDLWASIKPENSKDLIDVLQQIYRYSNELESYIPRANEQVAANQDALTALRLGKATALGKSRLFVSLARFSGLPARVVGGVVLDQNRRDPFHYWVEVNIDNQWVPFDPMESHFAALPGNYLELYAGGQDLFSHSPGLQLKKVAKVKESRVSPTIYGLVGTDDGLSKQSISLVTFLAALQIPKEMIGVFLLLPMAALCITFLRNVVGIKSFGVFMPMLIGAACAVMGLLQGLLGFTLIVLVAFIAHKLLGPLKLLKIPRLAVVLTIINLSSFAILAVLNQMTGMTFGMLALFPLVIVSFVADKLHELAEESKWDELLYTIAGTIISICISYLVLKSVVLKGLFAIYPELFLLVIAAQISLGRWTGIRLTEMFRFYGLMGKNNDVMGINCRNRDLVYQINSHDGLRIAADKLETKKRLAEAGIPVPETFAAFSSFSQISELGEAVENQSSFVVKPNKGSQGKGIAVIASRVKDELITAGNKSMYMRDIETLITEIISGQYSQLGDADTAFIEPMIHQHNAISELAPHGLADIRIILSRGKLQSAMLRLPTEKSGGKANLHQGALGAAVDMKSGLITRYSFNGREIKVHPDSGKLPVDFVVPHWQKIKQISLACSDVIPLGYMGVDICIDQQQGPLVLEVNGRPGLEIQNVQNAGLKSCLLNRTLPEPIDEPRLAIS